MSDILKYILGAAILFAVGWLVWYKLIPTARKTVSKVL